jgi:hypothetical protein
MKLRYTRRTYARHRLNTLIGLALLGLIAYLFDDGKPVNSSLLRTVVFITAFAIVMAGAMGSAMWQERSGRTRLKRT